MEAVHTVHLNEIGQIAITVRDLARSRDFYANTLGMKFLFDAGQMAFFQCGSIRLMLGASSEPAPAQPAPSQPAPAHPAPDQPATILYFKVPDIHAAHAAFAARGVPFSHPPHLVARMPGHDLWMAFLKDPDGNPLALMSEAPPSRPA
jgi:methylmalonyl-CoA/ethylmalonyl-CoA epimerase